MNIEELKQKALKCYGWSNASSAWLHESGDGSAVVGNIDDSNDHAIRNPVAVVDVAQYDGFQDDSIELAQFYAAANPAAILELIQQRNELLAALKDAWFTLDKLRTASNGEQRRYAVSFAGNTIHVAPILEAIKDAIAKAEG